MSENSRPVRILRELPLFAGMEAADLAAVAHLARYETLRNDSYFFHEGEPASSFYVLRHGRVKQVQSAHGGREILLQFVAPGEPFGLTAAVGGRDYPVSARAVGACEAVAWPGPLMAEMMAHHPTIAFHLLEAFAATVEDLRERLRAVATERVATRIARVLLHLVDRVGWQTNDGLLIDMKLSRQDLAEMTGTTLYTVSRILQTWERAGFVHVGRQRIAVCQRDSLAFMLSS